jgi:hypothetical protein
MALPTTSWRALLALSLFLGGIVLCILGVSLLLAGVAELFALGLSLGHGSAGIFFGLPLSVLGFWSAWRGRRMYRAIESVATVVR